LVKAHGVSTCNYLTDRPTTARLQRPITSIMMFWSQLITIAIIAKLATPNDRVVAYEIAENLAKRAEENLREHTNVDVILGATTKAGNLRSLDAIIVFRCDPCSRKLASKT